MSWISNSPRFLHISSTVKIQNVTPVSVWQMGLQAALPQKTLVSQHKQASCLEQNLSRKGLGENPTFSVVLWLCQYQEGLVPSYTKGCAAMMKHW